MQEGFGGRTSTASREDKFSKSQRPWIYSHIIPLSS